MLRILISPLKLSHLFYFLLAGLLSLAIVPFVSNFVFSQNYSFTYLQNYRRRPECNCLRPELRSFDSKLASDENKYQVSLCSDYATYRGPHQRIISLSLFGPKQSQKFVLNRTLYFLQQIIIDFNKVYSDDFILRIYHDNTVDTKTTICSIECNHSNIDFCSMYDKLYIPPKIWRFIPVGDQLVDLMLSRDIDSALTKRERAAVDAWITSNKLFHSMRDHPFHGIPMLGGMWGFRPSLNRSISRILHDKIHNKELIKNYGNNGDQLFLTSHVWPYAKHSTMAHDSFTCMQNFGHRSEPFPTQRPSANQTNCFVGCVRPCCGIGKMPFGQCPKQCRPVDHPEWIYC